MTADAALSLPVRFDVDGLLAVDNCVQGLDPAWLLLLNGLDSGSQQKYLEAVELGDLSTLFSPFGLHPVLVLVKPTFVERLVGRAAFERIRARYLLVSGVAHLGDCVLEVISVQAR